MDINPHAVVTLYPKIVLQDKVIIYSQYCTRSTRRNEFTADPERPGNLRYGKVQKFLSDSYPADSAESIHVAIIEELEIGCCAEIESLQFLPALVHTSTKLYLSNTFCPNALMFLQLVYALSLPWSVTQRF